MKKIYTALLTAAAFALGSCEHKELCYDHTHTTGMNVVFDWRNAPEASPATMSLYLFSSDDSSVQRHEFTDYKGGRILLSPGSYNVLCLNSDSETILLRGTDRRETFETYTRSASLLENLGQASSSVPRAEGAEDEPVVLAPDMLWSDRSDKIAVVSSDEEQTITFYPKGVLCTYTVEIRNAENLKYVTGLSGSLSGLAGSYFPGREQPSEQLSTLPIAVQSDGSSTVTGHLLTFGYHPQTAKAHSLVIYAMLSDGSKWYYTYDVKDQIHESPDKRKVNILLDKLPLPKPIVNGGGFQPGIDEWQQIDVSIDM